jgi:succinoglycan biosynthesis protein ExoM
MSGINQVGIFVCSRGDLANIIGCIDSFVEQVKDCGSSLSSITVVWNTSELRGQDLARDLADWDSKYWNLASRLRQRTEPTVGIPFARNKALQLATEDRLEWMIFIDDDCRAEENWLSSLFSAAKKSNADVIAGGWRTVALGGESSWLPDGVLGLGQYWQGSRPVKHGDVMPTAYTKNVLFKRNALDKVAPPHQFFDTTKPFLGGTDVVFFGRLASAGVKIVYEQNAIVQEVLSDERLALRWHFLRRIRNTHIALARRGDGVPRPLRKRRIAIDTLVLSIRVPVAILSLPVAMFSKKPRKFLGYTALLLAPFVGAAIFQMGFAYHEYATSLERRWVKLNRS